MSFPRYDSYRDSGVEWLGEVPGHWGVVRLKTTVQDSRNGLWGSEPLGDENDRLCIRVADFSRADFLVSLSRPTFRSLPSAEFASRALRKGDLLLEKSGGGEGQPVGAVVLYDHDEPAVCSNFVARVRLRPLYIPRYWCYAHAAIYERRLTIKAINQTSGIQNLDEDRYFNEFTALPPSEEQATIAAFLDRETAKIDGLIEEQRRLVVLLKEKRQAVISRAVTKGLNPTAPMKPSGVEWLGDVPAHWEVKPLKTIATIQTGIAKGKAVAPELALTVPYIRVANVQDGYIDLEDVSEIEIDRSVLDGFRLKSGDVLMNEGGDFDKLGRGCVWRGEIDPCIHQNHVFAVRPHNAEPEWISRSTYSRQAKFYFMSRSKQSTNLASISSTNLMELRILYPPTEERLEILSYLQGVDEQLASLLDLAQSTITLLQERRAALISAAVTGKIDVRGAVAAQPKLTLIQGGLNTTMPSARIRLLVATQIVGRLATKATFGRTQLQKHLHLAQYHLGIDGIDGAFMREAAGPLDRAMLSSVEDALVFEGFASASQERQGYPVTYNLYPNRKTYRDEFVAQVGANKADALTALLSDMADFNTQSAEAVSTLYAVWNDFLIDGITPTDEQLFKEIATNWHPNKSIPPATLTNMLAWMRRKNVVPKGNGTKTIPTMTGTLI